MQCKRSVRVGTLIVMTTLTVATARAQTIGNVASREISSFCDPQPAIVLADAATREATTFCDPQPVIEIDDAAAREFSQFCDDQPSMAVNEAVGREFSAYETGTYPCDANCDGSVNQFDITPFVNTLISHVGCSPCSSDANVDGSVNQFDIIPFVNCLIG